MATSENTLRTKDILDEHREEIIDAIKEYNRTGVAIAPSYVTFDGITTYVNVSIVQHEKFNGENVLETIYTGWNISKDTVGLGVSYHQRFGIVKISPVVLCLPNCRAVNQILHGLTRGAIDKITLATLSYNDNTNEQKATVQTITEFKSCSVIRVDPNYRLHFSIVIFTAESVENTVLDFKPHSEGGKYTLEGQNVVSIDTNSGVSTIS